MAGRPGYSCWLLLSGYRELRRHQLPTASKLKEIKRRAATRPSPPSRRPRGKPRPPRNCCGRQRPDRAAIGPFACLIQRSQIVSETSPARPNRTSRRPRAAGSIEAVNQARSVDRVLTPVVERPRRKESAVENTRRKIVTLGSAIEVQTFGPQTKIVRKPRFNTDSGHRTSGSLLHWLDFADAKDDASKVVIYSADAPGEIK